MKKIYYLLIFLLIMYLVLNYSTYVNPLENLPHFDWKELLK